MLNLFQDARFAFSPGGALFGPSGGDIGGIDGIGKSSRLRLAAMGDGIGFEEYGS